MLKNGFHYIIYVTYCTHKQKGGYDAWKDKQNTEQRKFYVYCKLN